VKEFAPFEVEINERKTKKGSRYTARAYCFCGSSLKVTSDHQGTVETAVSIWVGCHQDRGCGQTTAAVARRNRKKLEGV